MDDCIFCKIVKGDIPCFKIAENDKYLAFLDISPFSEGHTLVIPKKHYHFVWDVEDASGYFEFISSIANHFKFSGFEYVDSITLGRDVPHAHYHLIPHNGGIDWLARVGNPAKKLSKEEGAELVKKYKMN